MAKARVVFSCQNCGSQSPKWLGKCPDCNQWNTMVEEKFERAVNPRADAGFGHEDSAAITAISTDDQNRVLSGIGEFDRVLGGGLVPGSVTLIGGDPGIGKSTLLIQAFAALGRSGLPCLYVSGEESPRQIKMRAERLGIDAPKLFVLSETALDKILEQIKKIRPQVLVIDSIQTIFSSALPSAPGRAEEKIVWIESITSTCGRIFLICSKILSSAVSLSTKSFGASMPKRSARILIWRGDSSPET